MTLENLGDKKNKDKESERMIEDWGIFFKRKIEYNQEEYSEKLTVREKGDFELQNPDGSLVSLFVHMAETPENLYFLSKQIQDKFPELEFNFEKDKYGKWIKYTVKVKK